MSGDLSEAGSAVPLKRRYQFPVLQHERPPAWLRWRYVRDAWHDVHHTSMLPGCGCS